MFTIQVLACYDCIGSSTPFLFTVLLSSFLLATCADAQQLPGGLWKTDVSKRSIDLDELMSGGPPKDGTPTINTSTFMTPAQAADWLEPQAVVVASEISATGVFDPQVDGQQLTFRYESGQFVDEQTGSIWDITGRAIEGAWTGKQLESLHAGDYFAFAWFVFKPETGLYGE